MTLISNSATEIQIRTVDEMITLFEFKAAQEQQKIQHWQSQGLRPGTTPKKHRYIIIGAVGVIGVIFGIFLIATQNLPLLPGNASAITGYALLYLSTLTLMAAYFHREYVQGFNNRIARADANYTEAIFNHLIKGYLEYRLPNGRHVCISGFNRLKIYYKPQNEALKEWSYQPIDNIAQEILFQQIENSNICKSYAPWNETV